MNGLAHLLILHALFLAAAPDDLAPIPESERLALERLYESTDGSHWCNHDGWLGERGTECTWHGVLCTFSHDYGNPSRSVFELDLMDNNLVGALPAELDALTNLEYFRIYENNISGALPPGISERWSQGSLLVQGFGELSGVSEISLQHLTSAYCMDFQATLTSEGGVTLSSERCKGDLRPKWQGAKGLGISCEIQTGRTDRFGDAFGRLVMLLDQQGFSALESGYSRSITHGGDMTTSVVRDGVRRTITDYAEAGPMSLWLIETAIQGVIRDALWERSLKSRRCEWKTFGSTP